MANIVYIATSIDGYIARPDGNIDWLMDLPNPGKSDYGFSDFIKRIDAILMGRKTYETVLTFNEWPYPTSLKIFVISNSLKEVPENLLSKVELVKGKLETIIKNLSTRGINNLYIDGGKTIQSFLKEDLIDEMIITRIPIVLGQGIPLFESNDQELAFEHTATEVYDQALVKSTYLRKR